MLRHSTSISQHIENNAALANGALGHALDFVDSNGELNGHPTVTPS
jgi:2-methylcitrate dehydratase PrpD